MEPVVFALLEDGTLTVQCELTSPDYFDEADRLYDLIERLAEPLLRRTQSRLISVIDDGGRPSAPYFYSAVFSVVTRGKSLEDLYRFDQGVKALFAAAATGEPTRETVSDLIAGGRADLLVGLPEGPWLHVKSQHYDLTTDRGKISLAEAVGRFANAEEGGVIVVGMDTKRVPGGEIIKSIRPVAFDGGAARRYSQAIENRLFPFPVGLQLKLVETSPHKGWFSYQSRRRRRNSSHSSSMVPSLTAA